MLEKSCYRESLLEGLYRRHFVQTDEQLLGLTWNGALEFAVRSKKQVRIALKSILATFAKNEVELTIQHDGTSIVIKTKSADLDQVYALVEKTISAVNTLQED